MSEKFTPLADRCYVAPQITADDVRAAAAAGYALIVNNRPDGEMSGQPTSAEIEAAATTAGLAYAHIPIDQRGIGQGHIDALKSALNNTEPGKTLAFCRSGMRSTLLLAYAAAVDGRAVSAIVADADRAGYDIRAHAPALEALGRTA